MQIGKIGCDRVLDGFVSVIRISGVILPVLDRVVCVFLRGPPLLRLPTVETKEYVIVPLYYDRLCVQLSNPGGRA